MTTKIRPLNVKNKLATAPTKQPIYATTIKDQNGKEITLADPRATRALVALMNQHAVIGGAACHWGGPAAFAEMMSALHSIMFSSGTNWFENYNFVNDAGHAENGIYALRANLGFDGLNFESLRGFRSINSKLTGHGEAHLNPEGVFISNGPLGSGLPQAQGLALADKAIGNDRATICVISDGGCMEGEAREAMAAIPGLAQKGKMNPFLMIISDNDTKLGGRITEDSYDMKGSFLSLQEQGWDLVRVEEGHDLERVYQAIEENIAKAKSNDAKPVALVIKTIKGYGVKSTQEAKSGGHGYPLGAYDEKLPAFLEEIYSGDKCPEEFMNWANEILSSKPEAKSSSNSTPVDKVQPGLANAMIKATKEGLPVFSVTADLAGSTGVAAFQKEFPANYVDVGIAESNMVSTAVGMAKQGFIPVVDTFAQFGVTKGNLPLIMSQLSQGAVICLFSHTGFQDAADGASHQATTYFSAVAGIPNTSVVALSSKDEAESLMYQAIKNYESAVEKGETPETTVFFFGREKHPVSYTEGLDYTWGKAQVLRQGKDGIIVTHGPLVQGALDAAEELSAKGKDVTVINNPFINKIDLETFKDQLAKNGNKMVTVEDHQLTAGAGAMLCHALKQEGLEFEIKSLGNDGHFGQSSYTAKELYAKFGFDKEAIINQFS
ncbi:MULTISPECIES: transketolase C-terminal domain-containing protein [Halobacteriovorax]|uniref:transketolase C-terminal domain-containing protein n=1 Tax=Halobacteriovorax TaxID=1652133 RepID=UPI001436AA11|nr:MULTISPECIES: transketolase C-terminal domain-containing protein [Halobacteriovorax]